MEPTVFVWVWLPGEPDPVVAARLDRTGSTVAFTYGRSYHNRTDAISLYLPELPLMTGPQQPQSGGEIAGCIADGGPDAWGRRVIEARRTGPSSLGVLDYLLQSGSNRVGALDFQESAEVYVPRESVASLDELVNAADLVESGVALSPALELALLHGSSVGGARPKALLVQDGRHLLAKFSSADDPYPVVGAEYVAMSLARHAGLDVAPVQITRSLGKDVLIVERFDRPQSGGRRALVSALTILGLHEMIGRYATYADLADSIRARFTDPDRTLRELFARITFNILCGNTDDHAKNHAAFWDGQELTLTPAYDICPQLRSGQEAQQIMAIGRDGYRMSQVVGCVERADLYHLSSAEAREIVDHQIDVITTGFDAACDEAHLNEQDRRQMLHRQFLNPFATYDY